MKKNKSNKKSDNRYHANSKGITRMRIYLGNNAILSLCGDKSHYNASENDMLISRMRFVRIMLAMIVADYNGFNKYIHGYDMTMVLNKNTVKDMNTELKLLKANEVMLGGKYFNYYKNSLDSALKSSAAVHMELL